jgi:hypothetical protein
MAEAQAEDFEPPLPDEPPGTPADDQLIPF